MDGEQPIRHGRIFGMLLHDDGEAEPIRLEMYLDDAAGVWSLDATLPDRPAADARLCAPTAPGRHLYDRLLKPITTRALAPRPAD